MLDAFVEVLVKQASRKEEEDRLTELFMQLPMSELSKVASGKEVLAFTGCDDKDWLDKYEGTPLYDQALALEEESLQLEAESIQRRMENSAQKEFERQDMLRLKKRLLDLELHKQVHGGVEKDAYSIDELPKISGEDGSQKRRSTKMGSIEKKAMRAMRKVAEEVENPYVGGNHPLFHEELMADPEYAQAMSHLDATRASSPRGTDFIPILGGSIGAGLGTYGGYLAGDAIGRRLAGKSGADIGSNIGGIVGGGAGILGGSLLLDRAIPGRAERVQARQAEDAAMKDALQAEDAAALRIMGEKQGSAENPYAEGNHPLSHEELMADPEYAQAMGHLDATVDSSPRGTTTIPILGSVAGGTLGAYGGRSAGRAIGRRLGGNFGAGAGALLGGTTGAGVGLLSGGRILDRVVPGQAERVQARQARNAAFEDALLAEDAAALRIMGEKQGSAEMAARAMAHAMHKVAEGDIPGEKAATPRAYLRRYGLMT